MVRACVRGCNCPSRKFGGAEFLSFGKRMYLGRSAAGIGQPVGGGRIPIVRAHLEPAGQRGTWRLQCDRTQQFPARQFTLPDVRTDDEVRRLAAAQPRTQCLAVAPTDSPASPSPGIGASWSRDNTP